MKVHNWNYGYPGGWRVGFSSDGKVELWSEPPTGETSKLL